MTDRYAEFNDFCRVYGLAISDEFKTWLSANKYFTAPASRKYHGSISGGLFDHSLCVAKELVSLTNQNSLQWQRNESPVIVGLFHDLCKVDQYHYDSLEACYEWNDNQLLKGHGDKSVMLLCQFMTLTEEEILCIRYHMGAFTAKEEWNDYTRAVNKYPNVLWTHHADMLASHVRHI